MRRTRSVTCGPSGAGSVGSLGAGGLPTGSGAAHGVTRRRGQRELLDAVVVAVGDGQHAVAVDAHAARVDELAEADAAHAEGSAGARRRGRTPGCGCCRGRRPTGCRRRRARSARATRACRACCPGRRTRRPRCPTGRRPRCGGSAVDDVGARCRRASPRCRARRRRRSWRPGSCRRCRSARCACCPSRPRRWCRRRRWSAPRGCSSWPGPLPGEPIVRTGSPVARAKTTIRERRRSRT